ncbi:class I SAM-dependent methyltransferase [Methanooceanicella nereidis]|nr:class I SAM-dependent methyltransferase [Methanocella sp. CWC-04]
MQDKSVDFWSRIADDYESGIDDIIGQRSRMYMFNKMLELEEPGNVIELGCGTGFFTRAIAKNAGHVVATDISDDMLERAKENLWDLKNVEFRKMDCENIPFPDNTFDTVLMANILQIVHDPKKALHESYRILRPGGALIILFYTHYGLSVFEKFQFWTKMIKKFKGKPPYQRMLDPEEVLKMAEEAGFRVEVLELVGEKFKAVYLKGKKTI